MVSRLCDNFIICDRDKNLQEPELYPCARFGCSIPDSVWRVGRQRNKHTDRNVACSSCTNPELFLNLDWKTTCFKNYLEPTCWKVEVLFCACKIWLIVPSFSLKVAIWQDRPDNCPARFAHDGYERAALDCLPAKSTMTVFPREEINACICCVVKFVTDSKYINKLGSLLCSLTMLDCCRAGCGLHKRHYTQRHSTQFWIAALLHMSLGFLQLPNPTLTPDFKHSCQGFQAPGSHGAWKRHLTLDYRIKVGSFVDLLH